MRIEHSSQYTEHHPFYVYREFALGEIERKMLSLVYQPLIGAFAIAVFELLYIQVPGDRIGYSKQELQRKLFVTLGLHFHAEGRSQLIEATSRLEAVGLLRTYRYVSPSTDDFTYEYELSAPLKPNQFFANPHLAIVLRDRIGKFALQSLKQQLMSELDEEGAAIRNSVERESLSVPFYHVYKLDSLTMSADLQQFVEQITAEQEARDHLTVASVSAPVELSLVQILMRIPKSSARRTQVEQLKNKPEQLAMINHLAYKYGLDETDFSRLFDEDHVFLAYGDLNYDRLDALASGMEQQDRKRARERTLMQAQRQPASSAAARGEIAVDEQHQLPVPSNLQGRASTQQYNLLMRNEPCTKFVTRFFPGEVPEYLYTIIRTMDLTYKLPEPVINVLIHYVLGSDDPNQRVTKAYIDSIASNMLAKQIDTFEKAVSYIQASSLSNRKHNLATPRAGIRPRTSGNARKPELHFVRPSSELGAMSEEERLELHQLAKQLDQNE